MKSDVVERRRQEEAPTGTEGFRWFSADTLDATSGDLAAETRRAYLGRLRWVEAELNGEPLTDMSLSELLADMAHDGKSSSMLAQTVAAVRFVARRLGQSDPVGPRCEIVLRTNRRSTGPPRQVAAVDWADADAAADAACERGDAIGLRNAAVIAVMSDALLRVSEAAALDAADIHRGGDGSGHADVRRSKTDQENNGVSLYLRRMTMTRIDAWLDAAAIDGGALFRRIRRGGHVTAVRLTPRSIRSIITESAAAIGIEGASGHSLRIGVAQSLIRSGAQLPEAMLAGRWQSPAMLTRYARADLAGRGAVARMRPDCPNQ